MYKKQIEHKKGKCLKQHKQAKLYLQKQTKKMYKHTWRKSKTNVKAKMDFSINGVSITHLGEKVESILHTKHQEQLQMKLF